MLGVVIGAVAAILGGLIGEIYKNHMATKQYRRERMQEAYELAERSLIQGGAFLKYMPGDEVRTTIESTQIKFSIFASEKAEYLFDRLSDLNVKPQMTDEEQGEFDDLHKQLIQQMRKDLGIDKKANHFDISVNPS